LLACAPYRGRGLAEASLAGDRGGYAEVFIRKSGGGDRTVNSSGNAVFSGGVGY
jgi:hypothetical protein